MQTKLPEGLLATAEGREADEILRACVHCGFCNATCPTYGLERNELDGPRGRIWLIKTMLEEGEASETTQTHLDRCLTCRACETTCPSGVRYGRLLEIGREQVEARVPRSFLDRFQRRLLVMVVPYRWRFAPLLRVGQLVRRLLPARLREAVPPRQPGSARVMPAVSGERRVLRLEGCVQSLATPATDRALEHVLAHAGIAVETVPATGCCGALPHHLSDLERSRALARRNVEGFSARLAEPGVEGLIATASGCGVQLRDYATVLSEAHTGDAELAAKAECVAAATVDAAEFVSPAMLDGIRAPRPLRVAWQAPCTLQHGQGVTGRVEAILEALGHELVPVRDPHLCCGSAGTYSLLEPARSRELRARKLDGLGAGPEAGAAVDVIATANVGCQLHLAAGTDVPVRHWLELLADALGDAVEA